MAQYDNKPAAELVKIEGDMTKRLNNPGSQGERKHLEKELRRVRAAMERQAGGAGIPVLGDRPTSPARMDPPPSASVSTPSARTAPVESAPTPRAPTQAPVALRPTPPPSVPSRVAPPAAATVLPPTAPPSTGRGPMGPVGVELDQILASIGDDAMGVL